MCIRDSSSSTSCIHHTYTYTGPCMREGGGGTSYTGADKSWMSGRTHSSSAASSGGHRTLGDTQHSDNDDSQRSVPSGDVFLSILHDLAPRTSFSTVYNVPQTVLHECHPALYLPCRVISTSTVQGNNCHMYSSLQFGHLFTDSNTAVQSLTIHNITLVGS